MCVLSEADVAIVRVRFGIAFAVASLGALMGNPVDGALLGKTFPWIRPVTFSGVGIFLYFGKLYADASIGNNLDSHDCNNHHSPNTCSSKRHAICLTILYDPHVEIQAGRVQTSRVGYKRIANTR